MEKAIGSKTYTLRTLEGKRTELALQYSRFNNFNHENNNSNNTSGKNEIALLAGGKVNGKYHKCGNYGHKGSSRDNPSTNSNSNANTTFTGNNTCNNNNTKNSSSGKDKFFCTYCNSTSLLNELRQKRLMIQQ